MSPAAPKKPADLDERFVEAIAKRLEGGLPVRRRFSPWGRVHIDRPLPFLCVYRRPARGEDRGTERLVTSEASYLLASGSRKQHDKVARLLERIAATQASGFGSVLVLELWAAESVRPSAGEGAPPPALRLHASRAESGGRFLDRVQSALSRVRLQRRAAEVVLVGGERVHPRRLRALLSARGAAELRATLLGIEVEPVYRDPESGEVYPELLRQLRRSLSRALRQIFFHFARLRTKHLPRHFHVLGRRALVKAVWEVDRRLSEITDHFDLLLQLTPVNAASAWRRFERDRFERAPRFQYRPLRFDPAILKRRLFEIPVERVEDPALAFLFREKQDEVAREITLLQDLGTSRFLHGSLQLHGEPTDELLREARDLLERVPPRSRDGRGGGTLGAEAFAQVAREEIARYRSRWPELRAGVEVRSDIASGLMVSRGNLLVGKDSQIPLARVEALLQHEVGTHVLTYYNGKAQPFRQLYSGLAGYEAFQEGLAVLAEYLVGGLSRARLRLLAARVAAVRSLTGGAGFIESFRLLVHEHGFARRTAFSVAMRVHRGGGLAKDAVYLRGLSQVLDYLAKGEDLAPLYVGKISRDHVSLVNELRWREVLREPPLLPRFFEDPDAAARLERLRQGVAVRDLVGRVGR